MDKEISDFSEEFVKFMKERAPKFLNFQTAQIAMFKDRPPVLRFMCDFVINEVDLITWKPDMVSDGKELNHLEVVREK